MTELELSEKIQLDSMWKEKSHKEREQERQRLRDQKIGDIRRQKEDSIKIKQVDQYEGEMLDKLREAIKFNQNLEVDSSPNFQKLEPNEVHSDDEGNEKKEKAPKTEKEEEEKRQ